MTGFGDARTQSEILSVAIEVRSVNNRHLKLTVRGSEPYPMLEAEFEKVVRKHVRRGTLLVHVRVQRQGASPDLTLNTAALASYLKQIRAACASAGTSEFAASVVAGVLSLPGVAPESSRNGTPPDDEWPIIEKTLEAALARLDTMRRDEGRAMAGELLSLHQLIGGELAAIKEHLPQVMHDYRQRILERVKQAIGDAGVAVEPHHLVREVALYADRTDVAEEVTRLTAHLEQFAAIVSKGEDGAGRKLEFVIQEMGRETNTLGSKAGDVAISRRVVEIKAALEKIRELALNVE